MLPNAMTLPTTEHLAQLPHAELVALVTELIVAVQRLEAENQQLKAELAKGPPPPPTSQQLLAAALTRCETQPPGGIASARSTGPRLAMRGRRGRGWRSRTGLLKPPVASCGALSGRPAWASSPGACCAIN